jgi:hypothetical protein
MKTYGNVDNTKVDSATIIVAKSRDGSVEHYYHFLLGFLFPLVQYVAENRLGSFVVRSCGPMDSIMSEVFKTKCQILDRMEHQELVNTSNPDAVVTLNGFDHPDYYDPKVINTIAGQIRKILSVDIEAAQRQYNLDKQETLLFIDRGDILAFYLSETAEAQLSGCGRRSIPNFRGIYHLLDADPRKKLFMYLENTTLAQQIALFSSVDVIIAQHGAALANLVWLKQGTGCVEILPKQLMRSKVTLIAKLKLKCFPSIYAKSSYYLRVFRMLCELNGGRHMFVIQNHPHAEVSQHDILNAIKKLSVRG